VFVMSTAQNGTVTWADATQAINPRHFPVSAIAVDPQDASGNTAYVALMGFGSTHVWRTADGGKTWAGFDGSSPANLPDAPVNALVVDGGTVYAGTDAGVFASSTGNNQWVEVGNGSNSFLPNVSVTALRVFDDGANKLLRAATYGRGVWQYPLVVAPNFAMAVPDPVQTVFASETATFPGTVQGFDGFTDPVALSCGGTSLPATCSLDSSQVSPGGGFVLTAGDDQTADYAFQVLGTDAGAANGLTRSRALMLHVVDFRFEPPPPAAITLLPGQTSGQIGLPIDLMGTFPGDGVMELGCAGATGVRCSFFPSSSVSTNGGSPLSVHITVTALASAQIGSSPIDVSASFTAGSTKTVHQQLTLNVITTGFTVGLSSASIILPARQAPATVQATITAVNGYGSAVNLSCVAGVVSGSGPAPSCSVSPVAVTPSASGTAFQVTIGQGTGGSYSLNIQAKGTDANTFTQSTTLNVNFYDFMVTPSVTSQTVSGGQPANYTLSVTPVGLATFQQAVSFACAQLPAAAACTFDPSQVNSGDGGATVQLSVSTTAAMAWSGSRKRPEGRVWLCAMLLPAAALALLFGRTPRRRALMGVMLGCVLSLVILQAACGGGLTGGGGGGGGGGGTPPPQSTSNTHIFTVNVVEGSGTQSVQQQVGLTLVVQ